VLREGLLPDKLKNLKSKEIVDFLVRISNKNWLVHEEERNVIIRW
jgi:hypothetical protein